MDRQVKIRIFRERFHGRQDVYGRQWQTTNNRGQLIKGFAPKCKNFWTDDCHIKLKDGVTCARCERKEYEAVTDETVWGHITGDEPQLFYLVQEDGSVKFAGFDFDQKPGKEQLGHNFQDVTLVSQKLKELGIPHGIARSTGSEKLYGHHLYMFFDDFYPARKVRGFSLWLFEQVGFIEQLRHGIRPLPEFFPKQNYTGGFGPGNGIKPPMIEKNWPRERNGFVDYQDRFIPADEQWAFLSSIPRVSVSLLDKIIEENNIEIDDEPSTPSSASRNVQKILSRTGSPSSGGTWQHPLTGSFEKIIEGCAAMRRIFQRAEQGEVAGHQEGFAAYHLAMHCADGLEVFQKKMTGWGENERDLRQLEHSIRKDYAPWTCKKMQEAGVCTKGTKCFDKKPPIILVEGRYVHADDVPIEQWPEPSPIRYAFGKGDDFLEKLKAEVRELFTEQSEGKKFDRVKNIAERSQVFDEDQQRDLKEFIKSSKIIKARELSKIFNSAANDHERDIKEKAETRNDCVVVNENTYQLISPYGYSLMKRVRNTPQFVRLCSCTIDVEEERRFLDEEELTNTVYRGMFLSDGGKYPFEINAKDWHEPNKFMQYFGCLGGANFNVMRADAENVKQAAMGFADKFGYKKSNYLITQGWYQDTYLMPSVKVDVDGVSANTEKVVDLSGKAHSSYLGFKILEESHFREVLLHIKTDLLSAWPRKWTMVCIAHALLPAVVDPLRLRKKPTLFFEGLTGSGKTELTHTIQHFWGEFDSLVNLTSTAKGLMAVAHDFKDALLVFDDYKGLDVQQTMALQKVIQYSYDPNTAVKLNRDSTIRKPQSTRGVICFTGEQFVTNDAAMVARTILIEVTKQDTSKTREAYNKCIFHRKDYSGITPRFIHWFLQQDRGVLKQDLKDLQAEFYKRKEWKNNADRVSYNLALNHVLWKLFVSFMYENGVCTLDERDSLISEHLSHAYVIQEEMLMRCADEQNGEAFLRVLLQLIASGEVTIMGYNDLDDGNKRNIIGYAWRGEGVPTVNLYPDITYRAVKNATRDSPIRGTEREFGRQFHEMGILISCDDGRYKKQIRYNKQRAWVWVLDMDKLGLDVGLSVIQGGKSESPPPVRDTVVVGPDGLY